MINSSERNLRYLLEGKPFIKYKLNKEDIFKMKNTLKRYAGDIFTGGRNLYGGANAG